MLIFFKQSDLCYVAPHVWKEASCMKNNDNDYSNKNDNATTASATTSTTTTGTYYYCNASLEKQ